MRPLGHAKIFPVSGPTSHLEMTKMTGRPAFVGNKSWKKMDYQQQNASQMVKSQHKPKKCRHLCIYVEVWIAKPLSGSCRYTVVASRMLITSDYKQM